MPDHARDRQCAVSSCRARSLPDTTPLDIEGERVEVDLCPYHAGDLTRAIDALYEAAAEAELDDEDENTSDDELERLRLIETAAQAVVDLAATAEHGWTACNEYRALRMALGGTA